MSWRDAIDRAGGTRPAVSWSVDAAGAVLGDVDDHLRAAAAVAAADGIAGLTLDELTLGAVVASEDGNANAGTIAAIADATANRARGGSVYGAATAGKGFGKQGGGRPMSTRLAPRVRHLRAAVAVLRGADGEARGSSHGATQWLHWRTQDVLARRDSSKHCPARVVVERWCWGSPWADRSRCQLGARRAPALEWVGPVEGVDPSRLLLFRPATSAHAERWEAVQRILSGRPPLAGLVLAGALVLAGGV